MMLSTLTRYFLNPYFVAAIATIVTPILIHLLTKDRVKRVSFSTLRFFAKVSKHVLRKKKFQELLLLVMRMAACALLALAFARPLLNAAAEADQQLTEVGNAKVLVVDVSGSMGRPKLEDEMKKLAREAVNDAADGDAIALVSFDDAPHTDVPLSTDHGLIQRKLGELKPGNGGTDIAAALGQARQILDTVKARTKQVILVSDLQKVGWDGHRPDFKFDKNTVVTIKPVVAGGDMGDLAIMEVDCPQSLVVDKNFHAITARIVNMSQQERKDVDVTLTVNGQKVGEPQKVNLKPGASTAVRFRCGFKDAAAPAPAAGTSQPADDALRVLVNGDNPGTIRMAGNDVSPENDVYYFNIRVIPQIKVLVVNGNPSAATVSDIAFFVKTALSPTADTPFLVTEVPADKVAPKDLGDIMVVVLANVRQVAPNVRDALKNLLGRGGGVLYLPGDQVDPATFDSVFGDIAPCKLRQVISPEPPVKGEEAETNITKIDFEHPVFEEFSHPHHGDLSGPRFGKMWEVRDSQAARVPARFADGRPAVLERAVGEGVTMMLVSPPDLRWNNLALRAIFPPLVHQTVRYLAFRTEKRTAYRVGELLTVQKGDELREPSGRVDKGSDVAAPDPGFYTLKGVSDKPAFTYAVNRDPKESEQAVVPEAEIVAAVAQTSAGLAEVKATQAAETEQAAHHDEKAIWWYVLAALSLLLVAELFVGNRTLRH